MKKTLLSILLLHCCILGYTQSIGIGTNSPDSNAILDIKSDSKGILIPRMDSNARKAIADRKGMLVYDTTTNSFWINTGHHWLTAILTDGSEELVPAGKNTGDMLYWNNNQWTILPIGKEQQKLTVCNGKPKWGNCTDTLSLSPNNNPNEAYFSSYSPTQNTSGISQLTIAGWTAGGIGYAWRALIKFDLSSIPQNAIIKGAKISLYSTPTPYQGNGVDAQYGSANAGYIQRIVSNWNGSTVNWNTQPSTDATHQVTIPQSSSSFEDNLNLDVTELIKDILANSNYGFLIRLQNEVPYNTRQYASSFHADPTKHPKLIVYYELP